MKILFYIMLPLIAAGIGWFANWMAIKMLFYPRKKVRFLFFDIQGVFPKRQAVLAERLGQMVSDELLTVNDIKESMNTPEGIEAIKHAVENKVDEYLETSFKSKYPFISLLMGKKVRDKFKEDFLNEVNDMAPTMINNYMDGLGDKLDFGKIVRQRITILSPHALESLLMGMLYKEFRFVEAMGAMLGFVIGLIQVAIVVIEQHV